MRLLRLLLATVHVLVGLACSALAFPYVAIFLGADSFSNPTQVRFGQEFLPLLLVYFLPSLIGGIGLLFDAIWARRLLLLQAVAYLFLAPLGTLLGAAGLGILLFDPAIRVGLRAPSAALTNTVLTVVMVGAGMLGGLLALFRYHGDIAPMGLDAWLLPSVALFLVALVAFLVRVVPVWFQGRGPRPASTTHAAAQHGPIATGQSGSVKQIAYDRDPTILASCPHLQPIEADLRRGGVHMRLGLNNYVEADCCFDPAGLQRRYGLTAPVQYLVYPPERDGADETPAVRCTEHGFAILARPDKRFPPFP